MKSFFLFRSKIEKFPEPLSGIVEQTISSYQPGRVKCLGTSWPAQFYQLDGSEDKSPISAPLLPNEPVTIIAIQGITMLVIPVKSC